MSIPESALNYGSILTLLGENAEINGKLNNKPINFTHIAIGDGNDQYVQPSRTQTTLVNEITRIPITGMEKIEPSEEGGIPLLKVWAKIPDNIVDVAVREFAAIAVYDGNSYLHAVGNSVRIPILSGVNNGGEVNDIYIEMTFAVTSLDPIIMIDPTIVTATRKYVDDKDKAHVDAPDPHSQYAMSANSQFLPYDATRIYSVGEVCYTKDANGKVSYWEWYSNVESLAGKDPLDILNRQTGWVDETKPFYWTPFKKSRSGSTQWPWMSMTFPEGTLNVLGNSVPTAVFWRLAEALPEFVNAGTGMIDFPETGGEFFRVLDQGRGINIGRGFNTLELDEFKSHNHLIGLQDIPSQGGGGVAEGYGNLDAFGGSMSSGGAETRPRNLAFPILVEV
ncbi:phage tail protein [Vibrio sp. Y2-5]|uniref:phage tail protein n=1 Tax=Vibrio sp. Y2-5 TaxID=2743977 RepID=UPI00166045C3|nr:phage tail protein [Vibrio sp. Y2-5]MBD0786720.1 phage tail protein [Vibrio sp. Y2-5]